MAFNPALLVKLQPNSLFTDPATIPNVAVSPLVPQSWLYNSSNDNSATVLGAGYFNYFANWTNTLEYNNGQFFRVGDFVYVTASDGNIQITVTAVGASITTALLTAIAPGSIVNADVAANAAIDFSKLAALPSGDVLVGSAGNVPTAVAMSGDATMANTGALTIAAGAVTNAKVNAAAAIAYSKLAALPSGDILVGSAGNVATAVAMSGDATMANTGAITIAAGAITNAKVNAAAAIDFSKLAALPSADILVGSAGNVATAVAMSGDATLSNAGALTIGAGAVTSAKLDPQTIQYIKVPMTAAQWNAMYGAPFQLIAPPGAGKAIIVRGIVMTMTFVSASYVAGGAVICQYDSTQVHGGGVNACGTGTIAAAAINGFGGSASWGLVGQVVAAGTANSNMLNLNVALSNASGAFTTGDGTWNIHCWYEIVTL